MNRRKFHENGHRLVQRNRFGIWHGFVCCIYAETFADEAEAIVWVNRKEGTR